MAKQKDTTQPDPEIAEAAVEVEAYESLAEWRNARSETWTLPSGLKIKTRKGISIMDLIGDQEIPDTLIGFFEMALSGDGEIARDAADVDPSQLPAVLSAFNAMAKAAVIEPKITDLPTDETLGVNELSYEDKAAIFERTQAGANEIGPFRGEP
jgi:hypothetical protein